MTPSLAPLMRCLLVLPVLVLASACGGSDDEPAASGPTRASYLTQVEAICKTANDAIDGLKPPTSPAELVTLADTTVSTAARATEDFAAVQPPADDRADVEAKVVVPLRAQVAEGKAFVVKLKAAVASNDSKALNALAANPPTTTEADLEWMRGYGFVECVKAAETDG